MLSSAWKYANMNEIVSLLDLVRSEPDLVGAILRVARIKAGISQVSLADMTNRTIAQSTISRIEDGKFQSSVEMALRHAALVGIEPPQLRQVIAEGQALRARIVAAIDADQEGGGGLALLGPAARRCLTGLVAELIATDQASASSDATPPSSVGASENETTLQGRAARSDG